MNNSNSFLSIFLLVIIWQSVSLLASSDVFPSVVDILKSLFDHLLNKDLLFHIGVHGGKAVGHPVLMGIELCIHPL